MIFVDDGSPRGVLAQVVPSLITDPNVRVIRLSRKFGHQRAIMTGLMHATGDFVFLINSNLQEDPALLESFYSKLISTGADVVFGSCASQAGWRASLSRKVHKRVSALLSNPPLAGSGLTVRLMTADYVRSLVQHQERELYLAGLWQITGFDQVPMVINEACSETSSERFTHKVKAQVDAVTSFSNKPLVYIFYIGAFIFMISSIAAAYLIIDRIFFRVFLGGWPSVIVSIWMLGGLTIFSLGLLGIYISKIFTETKQRPYTIIREIYGANPTYEESSPPAPIHVAKDLNANNGVHEIRASR